MPPLTTATGVPLADAEVRRIADAVPQFVWMAAANGSLQFVNRHGALYTGSPPADDTEWDWDALVHPDDAAGTHLAWTHATRARTPYRHDCRLRRFDGKHRWHALHGVSLRSRGARHLWIGTATDIETDRGRADEPHPARHESASALTLLESVASKAPLGFAFVNPDLRLVHISETLATATAMPVDRLLGRPVGAIVPSLWPDLEELCRLALDTAQPVLDVEVVAAGRTAGAPWRRWSSSYLPVTVDGMVVGVGIVVVAIAPRRRTETVRTETVRRRLARIGEDPTDPIVGATTDGFITSWNAAAERLVGYTSEDIVGQNAAVHAPAERGAQDGIGAGPGAGGPPEHLETARPRRDRSVADVLTPASPAKDDVGHVVGVSVAPHNRSRRRETQLALEASQRRMAEAQWIAQVGSLELDLVTGETSWSAMQFSILGLDPDMAPSHDLFIAMVHPDDRLRLTRAWGDATGRAVPFDLSHRIVRPDGRERWVQTRVVPVVADDGTVLKVTGTVHDVTDHVEADRRGDAADARFEIGFEQAGIGAAIIDLDGIPVRVNTAMCTLLGRPASLLVGRRWTEFDHPDDVPLWKALLSLVATGKDSFADERRYLRPDRSVVWASTNVSLVRDDRAEPQYFLAHVADITGQKRLEEELAHRALHDSLTGLPNRALLVDRLALALNGSRRRGSRLGVMHLDIDRFKVVNDTLGHLSGDDLLRRIADRISKTVPPGDTAARFDGDEFVVVHEGASAKETVELATRVLQAVTRPYSLADLVIAVTASIGVAVADAAATPETLLRDSDAAMRRAKAHEGGRVEVFDQMLRTAMERRDATALGLRRALERDELSVQYQPIVDLITGTMVGAEALLRWHQPGRGLVGPAEFIPLAEEAGLIGPIGAWVLEQACRELVRWQRTEPSLFVAVNLSVRQLLDADVAGLIDGILRRTGAPPASLCLELTEGIFMGDVTYFGTTLARLKRSGVQLAIDDFGTGYSSLSYLKRFPVDAVKVDRDFVEGLGTDPRQSALVAAIVAMGDALGLKVTAEGVESRDQLAHLQMLGCRFAQGYYFARPLTATAVASLVTERGRWQVGEWPDCAARD